MGMDDSFQLAGSRVLRREDALSSPAKKKVKVATQTPFICDIVQKSTVLMMTGLTVRPPIVCGLIHNVHCMGAARQASAHCACFMSHGQG